MQYDAEAVKTGVRFRPAVRTVCNFSVGWCSKIVHALILAP